LTSNISKILESWESSGVAAAAELGTGLHLPTEHERVSRLIQITSEKTYARLQKEGTKGKRYMAHWHVDGQGSIGEFNPHWFLLIVNKASDLYPIDKHANLCVASPTEVDKCDTPASRSSDRTTKWKDIWDQLQCCPDLQPGDAVFYREDVAHRTQDQMIDRLSMVITIHPDSPPHPPSLLGETEDSKCVAWASSGQCEAEPAFMQCVCEAACRKAGRKLEDPKVEKKLKMLQALVASGRGKRYITSGCIIFKTCWLLAGINPKNGKTFTAPQLQKMTKMINKLSGHDEL
jgi:hypothetical protein